MTSSSSSVETRPSSIVDTNFELIRKYYSPEKAAGIKEEYNEATRLFRSVNEEYMQKMEALKIAASSITVLKDGSSSPLSNDSQVISCVRVFQEHKTKVFEAIVEHISRDKLFSLCNFLKEARDKFIEAMGNLTKNAETVTDEFESSMLGEEISLFIHLFTLSNRKLRVNGYLAEQMKNTPTTDPSELLEEEDAGLPKLIRLGTIYSETEGLPQIIELCVQINILQAQRIAIFATAISFDKKYCESCCIQNQELTDRVAALGEKIASFKAASAKSSAQS